MQISLEGKTALVTGASKGIGKAIAMQFAQSGANVMLSSRKQEQLEAAAAEIRESGAGGDVDVFAANAGNLEAARACVAATVERFGGLDILVNNAATNPHFGASLDIDEGRYDKTFEVNVRAPLFWSKEAWNAALKDKPGVIVNIASVGGLRAEFGLGVYNITKAAVIHMTRCMAVEWGRYGINVNCVAPTFIETPGTEPALSDREFRADTIERIAALHRIGRPVEVSGAVVFLASPAASLITGHTLLIDGGWTVR